MAKKINNNEILYGIIFPSLNNLIKIIGDNYKKKALKHEWYLLIESTWPIYKYEDPHSATIVKAYVISQNLREYLSERNAEVVLKRELKNLYEIYYEAINDFPDLKGKIITSFSVLIDNIRENLGSKFTTPKANKILKENKHLIKKESEMPSEVSREKQFNKFCEYCGSGIDYLTSYTCKWCQKELCGSHRLPESHECKNIEEAKKHHEVEFRRDFNEKYRKRENQVYVIHKPSKFKKIVLFIVIAVIILLMILKVIGII
ncbi:AN1-type zinc finger domain-containing protein [Candidatus Woesearchaeota archaeon]|nr:AN1-type zinc finger domain-containing protein [Candidatus Woesearchaeota archaeon]